MQTFIVYVIKWAVSLAILYVPFTLLMRKETFISFNRALLLCTLLGSLLLPQIEVKIPIEIQTHIQEAHTPITVGPTMATTGPAELDTNTKSITPLQILSIIYIIGVVISTIIILISIIRIHNTIRRGTLWQEKHKEYTLYCHAHPITPFSWFNNIVISEDDYNSCRKEIILHEEGHIKGGHSWDILIISLLTPLQWFNPFIYMLTNDLKDIHEYEADRYTLQRGNDARSYQLLILKKAIGEDEFTLVNNFARSSVRKRVEMMIRKKSSHCKLAKSLYTVPTAMIVVLLFSEPEYIYSSTPTIIEAQKPHEEMRPTIQQPNDTQQQDTVKAVEAATPTKQQTQSSREKSYTKAAEIIHDTLAPTEESIEEKINIPVIIEERTEYYTASITLEKETLKEQYKGFENYKCGLVIEFDLSGEGKISNFETKTCNLSIEQSEGASLGELLPYLREQSIEQAAAHIGNSKWHPRANTTTHYIATITIQTNETADNNTVHNHNKIMWIGTTPIK